MHEKSPEVFDARRRYIGTPQRHEKLVGGNPEVDHKLVYGRIPATTQFNAPNVIHFSIDRLNGCDMFNRVDLAIPAWAGGGERLDALVRSIRVEIGGQRIDVLNVTGDLETLIDTTCALTGDPHRKVRTIGGTTFAPLAMAPFHAFDMAILSALVHHELRVTVHLTDRAAAAVAEKGGRCDGWELYGNQYFVPEAYSSRLRDMAHEHCSIQSQFTGTEELKPGKNSVRLHFNHPVHLLFFWGFDPTKVTRVALELNGKPYYDGSLAALENLKASRGLQNVAPSVLWFNQGPLNAPSKATINFSRVDHARLVLELADDAAPTHIQVVGLNLQPIRYMCGMAGLVFSK